MNDQEYDEYENDGRFDAEFGYFDPPYKKPESVDQRLANEVYVLGFNTRLIETGKDPVTYRRK